MITESLPHSINPSSQNVTPIHDWVIKYDPENNILSARFKDGSYELWVISFDADDIEYLVNHLDLPQLRTEQNHARTKSDYAHDNHDLKSELFWHDFDQACLLARKIILSYPQPKPTTTTGHKKRFEPIDIERLKASTDIVDIASRYTTLRKTGGRYSGCCPFHDETKPSLIVYPDSQSWHCFGACNVGGDAISLVMKAERVDFKGAIAILGGR